MFKGKPQLTTVATQSGSCALRRRAWPIFTISIDVSGNQCTLSGVCSLQMLRSPTRASGVAS